MRIYKIKILSLFIIILLKLINNDFIIAEIKINPDTDSCFVAGINCATTYVYNNPTEKSYKIDSLSNNESFIAYNRNDSIFFYIKRNRPIEIMTDSGYIRSYKIVDGYVRRSEIVCKNDEELLILPEYMAINKYKKGLINDIDGYTNIRKRRSVNSEILGRILDGENFIYWILPSGNWYIVQTETGIRGFVYKNRIKENLPKFRNYIIK